MTRKVTKATLTPSALMRWRLGVGLTQQQLAEQLGITQQSCGHAETGLHPASPRTIKQILALAKEWGIEPPAIKQAGRAK